MARRSDHSRGEIREMAVRAAVHIIDAEGARALTARRVAEEIGYTAGTLYQVFENVDHIILTVNGRTLAALHTELAASVRACRTPESCIRAMGRAYIDFSREYPARFTLIFEHKMADREIPPAYREQIGALFALVEEVLAARTGLAPALRRRAARALWCGVHGVTMLGLTGKLRFAGNLSEEALSDSLVSGYLRGIINNGEMSS